MPCWRWRQYLQKPAQHTSLALSSAATAAAVASAAACPHSFHLTSTLFNCCSQPHHQQNVFGDAKPREAVLSSRTGKSETEILAEEVKSEKPKVRVIACVRCAWVVDASMSKHPAFCSALHTSGLLTL